MTENNVSAYHQPENKNISNGTDFPTLNPQAVIGERKRRTDVIRIGFHTDADQQDAEDHARCQRIVDTLYHQSPMITFLLEALKKSSCVFDRTLLRCKPCDHPSTGYFDPSVGVTLCQNFISSKKQVEETLSHELIHAFDYCTRNFNPQDCIQVACSEIRAASLSGDCKWMNEFMRGHYSIQNQYQACVKRRALMSIQDLPCCKDKNPSSIIESILATCMKDTRPFIDIPY